MEPARTSPAQYTPVRLVSRSSGGSPSIHRSGGTSRPVSTKPRASRATSGPSQSQCGSAPSSRNSPAAARCSRTPVPTSSSSTRLSSPSSAPPPTTRAPPITRMRGFASSSRIRWALMVARLESRHRQAGEEPDARGRAQAVIWWT